MGFMAEKYSNVATPKFFLHGEGCFMLKFASLEDRNVVLYAEPRFFYGKPSILTQWSPHFRFHEEVLKVILLWVRFPNLPLNYWGDGSLSRLISVLVFPCM